MKSRFICFSVVFFLACFAGNAQNQNKWKQISPKTWAGPFTSIQYGPNQQALVVGTQGRSIVTLTGQTWQNTQGLPGFGVPVTILEYASASVAWVGFQNQNLFKSLDHGRTWNQTNLGSDFLEMKFLDSLTGYALRKLSPTENRLVKTLDGGNTWNPVGALSLPVSYSQLSVTGPDLVWMKSGRFLLKSTNSGVDWFPQNVSSTINIGGFRMVNATFGYAWASPNIFLTEDGGTTWFTRNCPASFTFCQFVSPTTGWCRTANRIFRSSDGGFNWLELGRLPVFQMKSPTEGLGLDSRGGLMKTSNGTETWTYWFSKTHPAYTSAFHRENGETWICGVNGSVLKSLDKGQTWVNASPDSLDSYSYIKFFGQEGILVGNTKTWYTLDGGASWTGNPRPAFLGQTEIQFTSPKHGYAILYTISTPLTIHRTTDRGLTWTPSPFPTFSTVHAGNTFDFRQEWVNMSFIDSLRGFAFAIMAPVQSGGGGGPGGPPDPPPFDVPERKSKLYRTQNGGVSWEDVPGFPDTLISSGFLRFSGSQTGILSFISRLGNRFLSNGGSTLSPTAFPPGTPANNFLSLVEFVNDSVGYAYGTKGNLYKTITRGRTWSLHSRVDSLDEVLGMAFENGSPVMLVGRNGLILVDSLWSRIRSYVATGSLVNKQNNDCVPDADEAPLPNRIVVSSPGNFYTSTNAEGKYTVGLVNGPNQITRLSWSPLQTEMESQFCPPQNASISVQAEGSADTLTGNHFINEVKPCPILVLSQSHSSMKPCSKGNLLVKVQNLGLVASDSNWVTIKFPPSVVFVSANRFADFNALDSTYRFRLPPLSPQAEFTIAIRDSLLCQGSLSGQFLCIEAVVANVPPCLWQAPGWDGADLAVASRCVNNTTRFLIRNKGAAMLATSQYRIFLDSSLVYQAPFQLGAGSQMSVTLPVGTTGFARLEVAQTPAHPLASFASATAHCALGLSTNGQFPEPEESPLVNILCEPVFQNRPNQVVKVFPLGVGAKGKIQAGTDLKYTLRFQNTGTDTVGKVVLVDTLDENLDIASFQLGHASHPYTFKVSGKGRPVLTWTFDNILLPDSGRNQEASNGFVSFSIRPKATASVGTRLENFADIYFDFNDPIRTNTTVNTIWVPTLDPDVLDTVFVTSTAVRQLAKALEIFPNPSKGQLDIQTPESGVLDVFDVRGVRREQKVLQAGRNALHLGHLPPGVYTLRMEGRNGVRRQKLVLE